MIRWRYSPVFRYESYIEDLEYKDSEKEGKLFYIDSKGVCV